MVQETVVAAHATLILGEFTTEFEDFLNAALNITKHIASTCCSNYWLTLPDDMVNAIKTFSIASLQLYLTRELRRQPGRPPLSLWELLVMFRSRESTDPRDKVYAFLGLVSQWLKDAPLLVDYSIEPSETFKRTALKILTDMENLLLLTQCVGDGQSMDFPSWAPDWACLGEGLARLEMTLASERLYCASGCSRVQPTVYGDNILGLRGIKTDTVSDISTQETDLPETVVKWWSEAEALWNVHEEPSGPYAGAGWQDAFLRTLLCDLIFPYHEAPFVYGEAGGFRRATKQDIEVFKTLVSELRLSSSSTTINWANASLIEQELWLSFAGMFTEHQDFFFTSKKYMGMGRGTIRPGDEVWVLMGSPVPFVLRPLEVDDADGNSVRLHRLVGQCFVQGIMDGEAVRERSHDIEPVGLV